MCNLYHKWDHFSGFPFSSALGGKYTTFNDLKMTQSGIIGSPQITRLDIRSTYDHLDYFLIHALKPLLPPGCQFQPTVLRR